MSDRQKYWKWVFNGGLPIDDAEYSKAGEKRPDGGVYQLADVVATYLPNGVSHRRFPNSTVLGKTSSGEACIKLMGDSPNHPNLGTGDHMPIILKLRANLEFHPQEIDGIERLVAVGNEVTDRISFRAGMSPPKVSKTENFDGVEENFVGAKEISVFLQSWTIELVDQGVNTMSTQIWASKKATEDANKDTLYYRTFYRWIK